MRNLKIAALAAVMVAPAASLEASIVFDEAVTLNLDSILIPGGLTDIADVDGLDFGSNAGGSSPTGRVAFNGTDTNGSGILDFGDITRLVGHAIVTEASTTSGTIDPIDAGQASPFELTGVLRDVNGVVAPIPPIPSPGNSISSGFLDLYLDVAGAGAAFDVGDVTTSADGGLLVATFEILSGQTIFTGGPVTVTELEFILIDQLGSATPADLSDDFFQLSSGVNPLGPDLFLATQVISFDLASDDSLTGISGGGDPVDIFDGGVGSAGDPSVFDPSPFPGPLPGFAPGVFDLVSNVDGSANFGVIPEPTMFFVWGGLAGLWLTVAGRRKDS